MSYKVIPFVASLDPKKATSEAAATQLQTLINEHASQGWRYIRVESVTTWVATESGCFGFGGKPGYTTAKQMIVFEKTT